MEFLCTVEQIKEFKETAVWKEIKHQLKLRKQDAMSTLANPLGTSNLQQLGQMQGVVGEIDYMLDLPDVIIEYIHTEIRKKEVGNAG